MITMRYKPLAYRTGKPRGEYLRFEYAPELFVVTAAAVIAAKRQTAMLALRTQGSA
jgi:hypothetical protein